VSSIEYAESSIGKDIIIVVETEWQDISHSLITATEVVLVDILNLK
jgi:hypothetical protein